MMKMKIGKMMLNMSVTRALSKLESAKKVIISVVHGTPINKKRLRITLNLQLKVTHSLTI
jgi:acyl-CoA hydrolase